MSRLSVVIPAYNEEKMIPITTSAVKEKLTAAQIDYELIFVNDGSKDATWEQIRAESEKDERVRGVCFSRNFGKEAAIIAGLAESAGDCALVMDCDLQNPPEKIPEMYALWQNGAEIVEGVKRTRGKENAGYGLMSRLFNRIMTASTGVDMSQASDFKLLDRKVIAVLLKIREHDMFFRATTSMLGFKVSRVEFDVAERVEGQGKWTKRQLTKYALTNITSYTNSPMKVIIALGVIMLVLAIGVGGEALYEFFTGRALGGFTTVILLQLIIGSIMLLAIGVIGYYITRIFNEVRIRPRYVVSEKTNTNGTGE